MSVASPPRRAMVRAVRYFVIRPAALLTLAVVLILAGALVLLAPTLTNSLHLSRGGSSGTPPAATEAYLDGNRDYNAAEMWNSLSADAQQRFQAGGGSQQALSDQMQAAKDHGYKLENISYVGGKDLPDGTSMQFYVVSVRTSADAQSSYVPYTFTLDNKGKILNVQ